MFFFFQAEDGIRDTSVTGVQTCALPIYAPRAELAEEAAERAETVRSASSKRIRCSPKSGDSGSSAVAKCVRSEERRVGKECRAGWRGGQCRRKGDDKSADRVARAAAKYK